VGAPRAGLDREGTVFVVEYQGKEKMKRIHKMTGEKV
jgi:hypothetical protein